MSAFPGFIVFHVPHQSTSVPASVRQQFVLSDEELDAELNKMTDHQTLELFAAGVPSWQVVEATVSRLVVDVERFEADNLESMSVKGMGAVYVSTSDGRPLRRPFATDERRFLIDTWYRPHHERLNDATQRCLEMHGHSLVIDAHSFPEKPLPYEFDQRTARPEICVGTDEFHTSDALTAAFMAAFKAGGFEVRLNEPFGGALVPARYYRIDKRVSSVMVEVNRALYWNQSIGCRNRAFDQTSFRVRECILAGVKAYLDSQ